MKYKVKYQNGGKIYTKIVEVNHTSELEKEFCKFHNIITIKELDMKNKKAFFTNRKKEIYLFFKQLNIMLQSQLNFNEALELITQSNKDKDIQTIIELLKSAVIQNYPIDLALGEYKNIIGEIPLLFLKQGIENGTIKHSIHSIVILLEKQIKIKEQLLDKLRYPLFLILSLLTALSMIFLYVIPNFEFIFSSLGDNLPLATQVLLFVNKVITQYWYLFIFLQFIIVGTILFIIGRYRWYFDRFILNIVPVFSKIVISYQLYKLFLSLYVIVYSKYQFQTAIINAIETITNLYLKEIIKNIGIGVKNGEDIAQLFSKYPLFDSMIIKLLYTAQNTGKYELVLLDITNYYEKVFNERLKKITSSIEPLMIFIIALVVLWLILAIMVPIWELSSIGL